MLHKPTAILTALSLLTASEAYAEACDYRPSKILGRDGSNAVIVGGGTVVAGTAAANALGIYTLVHASSGLTMLGSTMAGASGAGTIGIIAGTGGTIGATVAATILNPFVWVPAAIIGIGGGGFEAACAFLVDEWITEFDEIMTIMRSFAAHADPNYFELVDNAIPPVVRLSDGQGNWTSYNIEDLYIVEGMLKHRDWGPNTNIGRVVLLSDVDAGEDLKTETGQ